MFTHEVRRDLAELFEGGFKVNDDLLGEDAGLRREDCRVLRGLRL
jgi:hypothetical protein